MVMKIPSLPTADFMVDENVYFDRNSIASSHIG